MSVPRELKRERRRIYVLGSDNVVGEVVGGVVVVFVVVFVVGVDVRVVVDGVIVVEIQLMFLSPCIVWMRAMIKIAAPTNHST
jgi:hypothetical protein